MKWGVICRVVYQSSSHTVNVHSHPPGRRMINVLISPAGTEIGREIWLSLRYEKTVKLFLAGSRCNNPACYNIRGSFILSDTRNADWQQACQALNLLYDIPFYFPAYDANHVATTRHLTEKEAKKSDAGKHYAGPFFYKFLPLVNTLGIIFSSVNDTHMEVTECWQLFIKPNGKSHYPGARTINGKHALEIQLCDKHGLPIRAKCCGYEYRVSGFVHEKYGNTFNQRLFQKSIQGGLSLYSPFKYEHHKTPVTVMRKPAAKGQLVKRRRTDSFFDRANHVSRNDKITVHRHTKAISQEWH